VKARCVVFDLDDTLYLERDYVWSGFGVVEEWVSRRFRLKDFRRRAWSLFEEGERGHIFDHVLMQAGLAPDPYTIQAMVALYRGHVPNIRLATDAAGSLQGLRRQNRLALVSDGPLQSQRNKVNALGLGQYFEASVLTAELGQEYAKPHPKAFLNIEKFFEVHVSRFIYVADNPHKDFLAPRSLGWQTIRVRRAKGLHSALEADNLTKADVDVPDLSNLGELIV
jgi:putative hydrolase of the HAD superfamily